MGENLQKCVLRAEHHTSGSAKEEFVVFVNPNTVEQWRKDSTKVLLNDVVPAYEIFCHVGGDHGVLGRPSNQQLSNHFGTSNETEVIERILRDGDVKHSMGMHGSAKDRRGPKRTGDLASNHF